MNLHAFRALAVLAAVSAAAATQAATHEIVSTHRFPASAGLTADLENLAGVVVIEGTSGRELVIEAKVVAAASSDAKARELAAMIGLDSRKEGDRVVLHARYPLDEYDEYKYDRKGEWGWGWNTSTTYQDRRVRISPHGVDVHVDFKLSVPKGVAVRFKNVVGTLDASDVIGDLDLDTASGPITAQGTQGRLRADTGSGSVKVTGHVGAVDADTGSGSVALDRIDGDVRADTGSGSVRVIASKGGRYVLDTGSGRITVEDSTIESLTADTGSGGMTARGLSGVRELAVDSGSGSVKIEGDLSAVRDLDVDSGSGGVTIVTTRPLNVRLEVDAGSGGVDVDLPNMTNVRTSRRGDDFSAVVGNGEGLARVSTGSGSARIRQQ